jgi:hypothetical protein
MLHVYSATTYIESISFGPLQSDKIERIFAYWADVYFWAGLLKIAKLAQIFCPIFYNTSSICINFDENIWASSFCCRFDLVFIVGK